MNTEKISELVEKQSRKAFFSLIKEDLQQDPPKTDQIRKIINELIEALCKFVPSRKDYHKQIRSDIAQEDINYNTMPNIVFGLITWIEKFQSPVDDVITRQWKKDFTNTQDCSQFIVNFLEEYYQHSEHVYKAVWLARKRLATGENIVPPEHRPNVEGTNGVPTNMKTGK